LALDRQTIEKKDFPISRRGYEPEAVDAHLEALAGEVEVLRRELDRAQRVGDGAPAPAVGVQSLAVAASEQVRVIVEAAESSASEIERSAEEQAARIRADADTEARRVREDAVARSQDHVGRVGEVTTGMLQRVDAMEQELGGLFESLRTGTNRLTADLSLLQGSMGDLHGEPSSTGSAPAPVAPRPVAPAPPAPAAEPAPEPAAAAALPEPVVSDEPELADADDDFDTHEHDAVAAAPEPVAVASRGASEDVEGARLIALNMALNGQSREETDGYLSENFDLADRAALLDEVYATVEG
jgi:DivIVA domain-containing protein